MPRFNCFYRFSLSLGVEHLTPHLAKFELPKSFSKSIFKPKRSKSYELTSKKILFFYLNVYANTHFPSWPIPFQQKYILLENSMEITHPLPQPGNCYSNIIYSLRIPFFHEMFIPSETLHISEYLLLLGLHWSWKSLHHYFKFIVNLLLELVLLRIL